MNKTAILEILIVFFIFLGVITFFPYLGYFMNNLHQHSPSLYQDSEISFTYNGYEGISLLKGNTTKSLNGSYVRNSPPYTMNEIVRGVGSVDFGDTVNYLYFYVYKVLSNNSLEEFKKNNFEDAIIKTNKNITVDGQSANEITFEYSNQKEKKEKAILLKKNDIIFEILFIYPNDMIFSQQEWFDKNMNQIVDSFQVK